MTIANMEVATELTQKPPSNIDEAKLSPEWDEWKIAMQQELNSMVENDVYDLVDRPPNKNIIKNRWVFAYKQGKQHKFKARLVAKGFTQKYGIDYSETFSPTAHYDSLKLLLALSAKFKLHCLQMDVKTAFLNANLEEEIYMEQPQDAVHNDNKKVWKLKKAIYGLKQAPRAWFETLYFFLKHLGFKNCSSDNSIFVSKSDSDITIILVYVDDLLIFASKLHDLNCMKDKLCQKFKMNEVENSENFIGFSIFRNENNGSISINQNSFVQNLI